MRLICGIVRLDGGDASADTLSGMVAALTPAGAAPQVQRRIEGAAALAVLEFSRTAAGLCNTLPQGADGTWLAADLRLDRPAELAANLGLTVPYTPEELALAGFARWGVDLPDRLDGDAALAFWRPKARQLILTRDIMGVRPLCWAHRPGEWFAFASLPKGLHGSGVVSLRPDPVALGRQLIEHYHRGSATGFQEISWLEAGHSLTVSADGIRQHRAWNPDPAKVGNWRGSAQEAAETLRRLVEEAVICRLPATGPVAAHLSGGLDSSAITVIAARALRRKGRRLHCWSWLPQRLEGIIARDDKIYVDTVLTQEPDITLNVAHATAIDTVGPSEPDLPILVLDGAVNDHICAAASKIGAEVMLSGVGGDETATYNGLAVHSALFWQGRWKSLWAELRQWAQVEGRSLRYTVLHRLILPLVPGWLFALRKRFLGKPVWRDDFVFSLLDRRLAAEVRRALLPDGPGRNQPKDRVAALTHSYLVGRATRWTILGARHGIAFSFPMADRRIIDFVLSLPLERFAEGGYVRQPFRNAMVGILPDLVRLRRDKFSPYSDLPLILATAKPGLQAEVETWRLDGKSEMLDIDAIAATLAAIPEGAEAERIAVESGQGKDLPPTIYRALVALRVMTFGRYMKRPGSTA